MQGRFGFSVLIQISALQGLEGTEDMTCFFKHSSQNAKQGKENTERFCNPK